jgi:hypothetical protein
MVVFVVAAPSIRHVPYVLRHDEHEYMEAVRQ